MDAGNIASVLAAIFAGLSAWAVQRSSSRAAVATKKLEADAALAAKKVEAEGAQESTRSQAETEAYERARAFDIVTIERQSAEILQVRSDNIHLNADIKLVHRENQDLVAERDALRNEIRVMHEERARERADCRKMRAQLVEEISAGRLDLKHAIDFDTHGKNLATPANPSNPKQKDDYPEPGDSFPDQI